MVINAHIDNICSVSHGTNSYILIMTLDPRHLLSKGALARLTNSDGLTAEVDLIKISMMITSILTMITMIRTYLMIMMIGR